MANVGTLSIKFTGDAKELENTFTRVGVKANLFSSAITAGLKTAAGAALDFVKSSVAIATENESTLTSFQNLTGSLTAAKTLYKDLLDFASKTPFSSKEIQSGATTLLGFGLSAKDATSAIKDLGAAAAANADTDLKRLVVSFGQIQGANVAMTKDLREFVNNGIPIYQILSDTLGVSVAQINEMASAGKLTGDVITRAFRESASEGGRFANTLETQSKTLAGLTSTLKDNFAIVLGKIGQTIMPALKSAVEEANKALIKFQAAIDAGALNPFIAGISTLIKNIGLLAEAFRNGIGPAVGLFEAIKAVKQASEGNFSKAWESAKSAAEEYVRPLKNLVALTDNIDTITASYTDELNKLNVATASAGDFMEDYAQGVDDVIKGKGGGGIDELKKKTEGLSETYAEFNARMASFLPNLKAYAEVQERLANAPAPVAQLAGRDINPTTSLRRPKDTTDEILEVEKFNELSAVLKEVAGDYSFLNENILAYVKTLETSQELQTAINASTSLFGSTMLSVANALAQYASKGGSSLKEFAQVAGRAAKENIGNFIREGVAGSVSKALSTLPFPANIIAGGIAGALAQTLFNSALSKIKIPAFGDGGVVFGPTLALIGEKGPEAIVPLGKGVGRSSNNVVITGVQYGADTYWQNANVNSLGRLIYGG